MLEQERDCEIETSVAVKTMMRKIAVMTLSLALIGNTGCTSLQTIEATEAAVVEHNLKVGDKVRLHRLGHRTEDVHILKLSESEMTATRKDGTVIVVDWRDIHRLEVEKTDLAETAKTVAVGVGIVVLFAVLAAASIYHETDGYVSP